MKTMQRWTNNASFPLDHLLVADSRICQTTYTNDQVWQLRLGEGDSPAVAWQTKYGGRANLMSLVPMWKHQDQTIYQAMTYHRTPQIAHVAPNYLSLECHPLPDLQVLAEHIIFDSQSFGGIYTLENIGESSITCRFELYCHGIVNEREQKLAFVPQDEALSSLSFGILTDIEPVVQLENGNVPVQPGGTFSPRIGITVTLAPKQKRALRWVHVGLENRDISWLKGKAWLKTDWQKSLQIIEKASLALPQIDTHDDLLDQWLTLAHHRLAQSTLRPTGNLPHGLVVSQRIPETGWSIKPNGADYPRNWNAQDPLLAWAVAPALATFSPKQAQGILKNYLAVQTTNGEIEAKPSPSGQKSELMCLPILSQLAWQIHQNTQDTAFLKESLPKLMQFVGAWLKRDQDQDNAPEWRNDKETGYAYFVPFAPQLWGYGAEASTVESPDLMAYLCAECEALIQIATHLNDKATLKTAQKWFSTLQTELESFWNGNHYAYRDRDTHRTTSYQTLLKDGAGDETHFITTTPSAPTRLVIRIVGGASLTPNATVTLNGIDSKGNAVQETLPPSAFKWSHRHGIATTLHTYTSLDRLQTEGLSRVYKVSVHTFGLDVLDINALLPLITTSPYSNRLIALMTDSAHFWQPNGITMRSKQSPLHADIPAETPPNEVWLFWNVLLGEALLKHDAKLTSALFNALLAVQLDPHNTNPFSAFYHPTKPLGLGDAHHLMSVSLLRLFYALIGVQIISPTQVLITGAFNWSKALTLKQHGIAVRRTNRSLEIKFASGERMKLEADAPPQRLTDPKPPRIASLASLESAELPAMPTSRTQIQVDIEE